MIFCRLHSLKLEPMQNSDINCLQWFYVVRKVRIIVDFLKCPNEIDTHITVGTQIFYFNPCKTLHHKENKFCTMQYLFYSWFFDWTVFWHLKFFICFVDDPFHFWNFSDSHNHINNLDHEKALGIVRTLKFLSQK